MQTTKRLLVPKPLFTILFIGWLLCITILSLFSFSDFDATPNFNIPYLDKLVHFTFYLGFVFFGAFMVRERSSGDKALPLTLIVLFVTAVIYGLGIEVLQYICTEDRMAETGDIAANTLGAAVGVWVIKTLFSQSSRLNWKI